MFSGGGYWGQKDLGDSDDTLVSRHAFLPPRPALGRLGTPPGKARRGNLCNVFTLFK